MNAGRIVGPKIRTVFAAVAMVCVWGAPASAGPTLALDYAISPSMGTGYSYDYQFTLSVDQTGGPLSSGDGWTWIVFGDAVGPATSPLADFVGDPSSIVGGPWTYFDTSGGGHNGPTLEFVLDYWTPATAAETVSWSGLSNTYLGQGNLLFSSLMTEGNAVGANFAVANLVPPAVPEPSTLMLASVAGCVGLGVRIRHRKANSA